MLNKWALWPSRWGNINILFPFHERFQIPAEKHDLAYCLWTTEQDKQEADLLFFEWCLDASWKNPIAIWFSVIYYIMVAKFWYKYFNWK